MEKGVRQIYYERQTAFHESKFIYDSNEAEPTVPDDYVNEDNCVDPAELAAERADRLFDSLAGELVGD
jgi:hypothetical protein